jgi:Family of unknown function (DUF6267)
MYDGHMKNTHLEHPEDSALLGKKAVQNTINYLRNCKGSCTVKYDGAPAIVFGTNPENGKFFVGTKSVFNKVKVKINYTHADIEKNHGNNLKVAGILHTCLETLPKVEGIYQGDFIGFGGTNTFTPNTITYAFDSIPDSTSIVFACHTSYEGDTMKELTASFSVPEYLKHSFMSTYFVNTDAVIISRRRRIDCILGLASVVSNFVKYPETKKEVDALKIAVNKCIREGRSVSDVLSGNLLLLFNLLTEAKLLLMEGVTVTGDDVRATIELGVDYINSGHEGYVHCNDYGAYKLVNREVFSHYNFTLPKSW